MTDYGVTLTGFVKKTLTIILDEIKEAQKNEISTTLNLLDTAVFGQINGVFADKLRELWDVAEAVYRAMYPDSASGSSLEDVASITGAERLPAAPSEVTLNQLFLDAGTTVPIGSVVSVGADGARFVLTTAAENSGSYPATVSAEAESEDTGEIVGNAKTIDTIQTPVSGWNAKAARTCDNVETYALDGEELVVAVDGVNQSFDFPSSYPGGWTAAQAAAEIESQLTGVEAYDVGGYVRVASTTDGSGSSIAISGDANTYLGFVSAEVKGFNTADADTGRDLETDIDFRIRRDNLLGVSGAATVEAIRADVLLVDGVTQAFVFENVTDAVDGDGLPPHSFEVVVSGGVDQDIADAIWLVKPAGIVAHGTTTKTVTDSMGFSHTIKFSRPTPVPIYIDATLTTDSEYPADGDDQVKTALVALGDALEIGEDVTALVFKATPLEISGVLDVTVFEIDDVTPPTGTTNITIASREIATFDTSDIRIPNP